MGILKDGGYLPDPQPIWKCPADSEFRREGPLSLSPYTDFFDPFETSYCGHFQHHSASWPCTNGSNATDNNHVDVTAWPTVIPFSDSMHRYAIDFPNHLFCDGHAQPFNLNDLHDPENYAIEGWNQN